MAPNSNTPPEGMPAVSESTVAALREALTRHARRHEADAGELRRELGAFAAEARASHVGPEKLLVLFKGLWAALPEVRAAADRAEKNRVLERLVTICIEEYYRER